MSKRAISQTKRQFAWSYSSGIGRPSRCRDSKCRRDRCCTASTTNTTDFRFLRNQSDRLDSATPFLAVPQLGSILFTGHQLVVVEGVSWTEKSEPVAI